MLKKGVDDDDEVDDKVKNHCAIIEPFNSNTEY
jgi:hypothetical protein